MRTTLFHSVQTAFFKVVMFTCFIFSFINLPNIQAQPGPPEIFISFDLYANGKKVIAPSNYEIFWNGSSWAKIDQENYYCDTLTRSNCFILQYYNWEENLSSSRTGKRTMSIISPDRDTMHITLELPKLSTTSHFILDSIPFLPGTFLLESKLFPTWGCYEVPKGILSDWNKFRIERGRDPEKLYHLFQNLLVDPPLDCKSIEGTWNLVQIRTENEILSGASKQFRFTCYSDSTGTVETNLEVNFCNFGFSISKANAISFNSMVCSEACCDSPESKLKASILSQLKNGSIKSTSHAILISGELKRSIILQSNLKAISTTGPVELLFTR